ncbi:MAG: hypothetical protein SGJ07_15190 [Rhodospirillaceae bacterium]|nr:hypothetical protein [Rhodospirillaceae bacterium]
MPRFAPVFTTFNAGEWSPELHGRVDLAKYSNACRVLRNMIPLPQGAATRRPGTRFVATAKETGPVRLIPFQFSAGQAYVIEAGEQYFRFYAGDGRIEEPPGTPFEIATPYAAEDLAGLQWAQSADVLYLVHRGYAPRQLNRLSHTNWTLTAFEFEDGPYLDLNTDASRTLDPSAATGSGITLTTLVDLFVPAHVGSVWRLEETAGHLNYGDWEQTKSYPGGQKVKFADRVYETAAGGTSGTAPPLHSEGTESDQGTHSSGVSWTYLHSGHGWVRITAYTSATQVTADVLSRLPSSSATKRWREGAWSDHRGWPAAIGFYEDRLFFANTAHQPQTLWGSASGAYSDFSPTDNGITVLDDTAMTFTIADNEVNAISWLSPGKVLIVGTEGGEFTVQASNLNEAVTPGNLTVRAQSNIGCSTLPPVRAGGATLFVQRARRKLYEIAYRFESDSYGAPEMTILASHLVRDGIAALAFQRQPWSVLWALREDGLLLGFTYLREQDVIAWHRHDLGGSDAVAIGAVAIPADGHDRLWLAVRRQIDGQKISTIEYLESEFWPDSGRGIDNAFFVDSGLSYDGWNMDPAKRLTLQGGAPWTTGAVKTLVADGHSPFLPDDAGKCFRLGGPGIAWPPVAVEITAYNAADNVSVRLVDDVPPALQQQSTAGWARMVTTLSGFAHLEGETVQVLADGAAHPARTVVDGGIALQQPASIVHAGLGYESRLETLDLEAGAVDGTAIGKAKRIHRATVRLFASLGCAVGFDDAHLDQLAFRGSDDPMDRPPPLFTGDRTILFPKGWDRAARVLIVQSQPLPLTVAAIAPHLTTNG